MLTKVGCHGCVFRNPIPSITMSRVSKILIPLLAFLVVKTICSPPPVDKDLRSCGSAYYVPSRYTCYPGDLLCPTFNGEPTLPCGPACYEAGIYGCSDGELTQSLPSLAPGSSGTTSAHSAVSTTASAAATCTATPTTQHLSDPPYENYFYSDCHGASQVVITSPLSDSNLTIIGPRLLVAWPAGNSGIATFFAPRSGVNGSLGIELMNVMSAGQTLSGVYVPADRSSLTGNPRVGVTALIWFNASAVLTVPVLGSIRTIRDFTEGPSILVPEIQDAIIFSATTDGVATLSRLWLDNMTTTEVSFAPMDGNSSAITIENRTLTLEAGTYNFSATFDYPQLTQLSAIQVLNPQSRNLTTQDPSQTTSLSFLSYSEKLLAGAWRFLTYFGRDSMISLLLLAPVLSEGEGGAVEAVISAVLERINQTDGSVCHEETIGDYATYLNLQDNITSTAPSCSYIMIDSDYYLMPVMQNYFLTSAVGSSRRRDFFATKATLDFGNRGMIYAALALMNAEKIMNMSTAFAQPGGQTVTNLMHLKEGQIVGEWRDSTYGIGGGRIPYDVNTALVPAALRAIAALVAAGFFPEHPEWNVTAAEYAQVWEDDTLRFFAVSVSAADARALVNNYTSSVATTGTQGFPSRAETITADVAYYGLSLDGNDDQPIVKVMNTDDCFRHFLLNTTDQAQLTAFVNQTANNILRPFPAGLSTPVGLLVANPAYGGEAAYAANWTTNTYHGTVVWSWPMAMMAAGLHRQLGRCAEISAPAFCADAAVYSNVRAAYNHLWDLIAANTASLSSEVWSWVYRDGEFILEPLGALAPPLGASPTESDVRQLWSLTFLAVGRDESLR